MTDTSDQEYGKCTIHNNSRSGTSADAVKGEPLTRSTLRSAGTDAMRI